MGGGPPLPRDRERRHQVRGRLGGEGLPLGQRQAEPSLDPEQQLHPGQAVEPKIILEVAVHRRRSTAAGVQLGRYVLDQLEQAFAFRGRRGLAGATSRRLWLP